MYFLVGVAAAAIVCYDEATKKKKTKTVNGHYPTLGNDEDRLENIL